ncbi:SWIRM domain-containing protein [Purpureocillium lavendulum]|uniref:SWIRM domain-containing protein n=1 Tax=Purpureocillium lavendulum TaxID=1247861 RepID=A0AB34FDF2_9HYPO|nr:SWIRM domain-containing protein [Purpureocillium lavendulum]
MRVVSWSPVESKLSPTEHQVSKLTMIPCGHPGLTKHCYACSGLACRSLNVEYRLAQSMQDPTGKDLNYWHDLKANIKAQSGRGTTVLVASANQTCTLHFRSRIMKLFTADRKGWLRRNRALLESDRRARPRRYQVMAKSNMADWNKHEAVVEQRMREDAGQVQTPTDSTLCSCNLGLVAEPCQVGQASREDKTFMALPDYSPSLNTLSHRTNCLKVDWNGRPLDLGDDPHGYLLHPEEVTLASTLRLDCATYLTSKRRIFQRRLECLRISKEFRKTDAQKACKIDVNKASKMWTAFKTVGWLDESFMRQFL